MGNAPTTQPTNTVSGQFARSKSENRGRCWKVDANGFWDKVDAPWKGHEKLDEPEAWFCRNAGRMVFTSRRADDLDDSKPVLEVYEIRDADPNDWTTKYIGCFEGMEQPDDEESDGGRVEVYFLLDTMALPKLITEFAPMLNYHPIVTRESHLKRKEEEREARLKLATLPRTRQTNRQ
jgi:hypothetical protein